MGDLNSSDCSWKKMVIAKTNHEWVSKIKCENPETLVVDVDVDEGSTTNFSISDESSLCYENNTSAQNDEPEILTQSLDPLMIVEPKQQRRRSSITKGLKNETPEERSVRLAKMSAYAAQRLANETPEQRAARLRRMSQYAARRLAQETSEQREQRLARMSAYAAKRLAEESPEQRRSRLSRMSAYAARRQAMKKVMSNKDLSDPGSNTDTPNRS